MIKGLKDGKIMIKLFNTVHEIKLRLLLLMNVLSPTPISCSRLRILDQLTLYGLDYKITSRNLNGNNKYKLQEYISRHSIIQDALNNLVLQGYAEIIFSESGFQYKITHAGSKYCDALNDDYKDTYSEESRLVVDNTHNLSDLELEYYITSNE